MDARQSMSNLLDFEKRANCLRQESERLQAELDRNTRSLQETMARVRELEGRVAALRNEMNPAATL